MIWLVVILSVCVVALLLRKPKVVIRPELKVAATVIYGSEPWADNDPEIAKWVRSNPQYDKWFWGKVAGVTHDNANGRSRQEIIRRCQVREMLRLEPEPSNPVDPDAIAVLRQDGEQIGYLNRRLARETRDRMLEGERWEAMISAVTGIGPHPHPWQGVNIVLLRLKNEQTQETHSHARKHRSLPKESAT